MTSNSRIVISSVHCMRSYIKKKQKKQKKSSDRHASKFLYIFASIFKIAYDRMTLFVWWCIHT